MKKKSVGLLCAVMMLVTVFASYAAEAGNVTAAELAEAAAVNISSGAEDALGVISELHEEGARVFDTAGILTASEADKLNSLYVKTAEHTGFDIALFTTNGYSGASDADDYADMIYYGADLGTGDDRTGTILVINMDEREAYIYTHGEAVRYITDSQQNYIYDELEGGLYNKLADGDYASACAIYAEGVADAYDGGIYGNQSNYDTETGSYDNYVKKHLSPGEIIAAAVISAVCGIMPVAGIRRKYAMKSEKRMAEGFNLAYRADAAYVYAKAPSDARLISRNVSRVPIVVVRDDGPHRGGGGHGGGISSVSSGRGGSMHGGSGRRF